MKRKNKQIGMTIDERDYESARILALKKRTSVASVMREALVRYVQDNFDLLKEDEIINLNEA